MSERYVIYNKRNGKYFNWSDRVWSSLEEAHPMSLVGVHNFYNIKNSRRMKSDTVPVLILHDSEGVRRIVKDG